MGESIYPARYWVMVQQNTGALHIIIDGYIKIICIDQMLQRFLTCFAERFGIVYFYTKTILHTTTLYNF